MPVYTYRCDECGVQFEQHQKFTDDSLVVCPECGQEALKKVYHPVGIVFKGSGFYATDHHSPSGQKSQSASDSDQSSEKKDGEAKTAESPKETKPAKESKASQNE
jgi:putative FmdB family regulatory protein